MKTYSLLLTLATGAFLVCPGAAQTNLVRNGSFEEMDAGWTCTGRLRMNPNLGAAHGTNYAKWDGVLWQDMQTVPGREYVLSFAIWGTDPFTVTWDGQALTNLTELKVAGLFWYVRYTYVTATGSVARLSFSTEVRWGVAVDDVKVGWLHEPIWFAAQPEAVSAWEGGSASFAVTAEAAPPVAYQWLFNSEPISGANNPGLALAELRPWQAGLYSVAVSNLTGVATSAPAMLQLEAPPTSPVILIQPSGDLVPVGYAHSLAAVAVGEPPLSYRWSRDGVVLPDATNATLLLDPVSADHAGTYTVVISNLHGSTLSLPAVLATTNTVGGGMIRVDTFTNNAVALDVDGVTRLGSAFSYQIYAGSTPDLLRPLGPSARFPDNMWRGYVSGAARTLPDVAAGQTAWVQLRAWEAARGATYEECRARGGRHGASPVAAVTARTSVPYVRPTVQGLRLRAGLPFFHTGRLAALPPEEGEPCRYVLTGQPGARYLIEKSVPPQWWVPWRTVTNVSGTVMFNDPEAGDDVQLYRSRMLE